MLTPDALRERRWRDFPMLQRALEGKPRGPREWDYLPSTWETSLDRIGRVLDIAMTAIELRGDVWDVARSSNDESAEGYEVRKQVHEEISHLAGELSGFAHMVTDLSNRVERLHRIVEQPDRPTTVGPNEP